MNILVGCEFSGTVRRSLRARGHDAYSCDLLPSSDDSEFHIQGDVFDAIASRQWDAAIFHPPCTHLAVSGSRWFKFKQKEQAEALEFVQRLLDANIPKIALENPISIISSRIRKPNQIVQPWMFGHGETKATCLWLVNLPKLVPAYPKWDDYRVAHGLPEGSKPYAKVHRLPPSADRWALRSLTYPGIAEAMAEQWFGHA